MTKTAPVEEKVRVATAASFLVSVAIAVLNSVAADSALLGPLPDWLQVAVIALVPAAVTFLSGWAARHTPRGPSSV